MKNGRDYADAYAETLVMPDKQDSPPASGGDRDPLALYEEYVRELTNAAAATVPPKKR